MSKTTFKVGDRVRLAPGQTATLTDVSKPACHREVTSEDVLLVTKVVTASRNHVYVRVQLDDTDGQFTGTIDTLYIQLIRA